MNRTPANTVQGTKLIRGQLAKPVEPSETAKAINSSYLTEGGAKALQQVLAADQDAISRQLDNAKQIQSQLRHLDHGENAAATELLAAIKAIDAQVLALKAKLAELVLQAYGAEE